MRDNKKTCRTCGERKPIREFPLPKLHKCLACYRELYPPGVLDKMLLPSIEPPPGIEPHRWPQLRRRIYQRNRARVIAEQKRQAQGKPEPRVVIPWRHCRICQHDLPIRSMANNGRGQICLQCEKLERE